MLQADEPQKTVNNSHWDVPFFARSNVSCCRQKETGAGNRGLFNIRSGATAGRAEQTAQVTMQRLGSPGATVSGTGSNAARTSSVLSAGLAVGRRDILKVAARGLTRGKTADEIGFAIYAAEQRIGQSVVLQQRANVFRRYLTRQRLLARLRAQRQFLTRQEAAQAAFEEKQAVQTPRLTAQGVPSSGGLIRSFVTTKEQVYYRVFSENPTGRYLMAVPPQSRAIAIEGLALPPGNRALFIQEVRVPSGVRLQRSRALPAFEKRGGLEQFELLEELPKEAFGPPKRLE